LELKEGYGDSKVSGTGVTLTLRKFHSPLLNKLVTAIDSYGDLLELCILTFHIGYASFIFPELLPQSYYRTLLTMAGYYKNYSKNLTLYGQRKKAFELFFFQP
jgi:hypothetical protein